MGTPVPTTAAPQAPGVRSVFAAEHYETFSHRYNGRLRVGTLVGGVPTDPDKAEAWLKSKLSGNDDLIQRAVAETMAARGIGADEAVEEVAKNKVLNGFKRDENGLYIEGRQLKAAIKEAISVAVAGGHLEGRGWGRTNKGVQAFAAEHVFITDDRMYLYHAGDNSPVLEPSGITQRFVHTWRGSGIQQEEYVTDVELDFTLICDVDFDNPGPNGAHKTQKAFWPTVWTLGELQGIGATRSMGFGTYRVTRWEKIAG